MTEGVFLRGLKSIGEVRLSGAEIGGSLDCMDAELDGAGGLALNAQDVRVTGEVFLRGVKSKGEVFLAGAEIGGQLDCTDAELDGRGAEAINAEGLRVKGHVLLWDLNTRGEVCLIGAAIGGELDCGGAELDGGDWKALNAQRLVVKEGFIWRQVKSAKGEVDLNAAHLGDLVDDAESWDKAAEVALVGLTYDNLVGPLDLGMRKAWLKKGAELNGNFHPQPYQQLAKVFRESGHRRAALEILVEKEIEQRKSTRRSLWRQLSEAEATVKQKRGVFTHGFTFPGRVERDEFTQSAIQKDIRNQIAIYKLKSYFYIIVHCIIDFNVGFLFGYGVKKWRIIRVLPILIIVLSVFSSNAWNAGDFAPNSPVILTSSAWIDVSKPNTEDRVGHANPASEWSGRYGAGRDYETFAPLLYAVDMVVPIVDLGQSDAWAPSTTRGPWGWWLFYLGKVFALLGWMISTYAVAFFTGMIRLDD
ncbi:hypothetical protein DYI23_00585 [Roseibium polysiphoniae]|uniref:Uncharacterized protein n=1 Tax=Roseibium polysiphoniae TaxID=2571221 RepID=A0A944GQT8_9HYPH|nr:hypothetical protein [Roseibium polysiphoniae]